MLSKYAAILRVPGTARVLGTALLGRLPQGMESLAILLLVRAATHSYAAAGVAVGGYALACGAAAPVQGRLVGRFGRARVLAPASWGQAAALVALVLAARGRLPAVVLIAAAIGAGSLQPAIAPVVRALLGELIVDPDLRETAYALDAVVQELIWIVGPLAVAIVITLVSPAGAVLVNAAVCVVGTLLFVGSPLVATAPGGRADSPAAPRGAALASARLRALLVPVALMGLGLGATDVGIPSLALHAGSRASTGLLLALWGLGSLAGGLWFGSRAWRLSLAERYRRLLLVAVLCTAPLIAARTIPEGMIGVLLAGVTVAPVFSCQSALVGAAVEPGSETEAFTWVAAALMVGVSAGSALGGIAISAAGVSAPFVLGTGALAFAATAALRTRRVRRRQLAV